MTRDQILQLGQSGSPWTFPALAMRALAVAPADGAMRFLLVANLAKLLLRTPALEQLAVLTELAPSAVDDPQVLALRRAIESLPEDEISVTERIATARANVQALTTRGIHLRTNVQEWEHGTRSERWFRARGGNIVRLSSDASDPAAWRHLSDIRTAAAAFVDDRLAAAAVRNGVALEGVDPPWLLMAAYDATRRSEDGFTPRLRVLQADERELLDGLACADLGELIADSRVGFFVGEAAGDRLLAELSDNLHTQFAGPHLTASTLRTRISPPVTDLIQAAAARQSEELQRVSGRLREIYAGRDRAWWARRFAEGLAAARDGEGKERGRPLRVLIPTYRHSTFVRHSAADIASALASRGIDARVMMEPDDHTCLNTLAHAHEIAAFEPDLLIVINYPRAWFGDAVPANVPYVCWVQDAMPHLQTEEAGRGFNELEFLVGHTSDELFDRFGYPRERAIRLPVVASEEKFSNEPAPSSLLREHECELAYVSHHSETPEQLTQRLMRESGDERIARCVAMIAERLPAELAALHLPESRARLLACVRGAALDVLGVKLNARAESQLLHGCALRLADRMLRHEMLAWADAVCRRRGWRLRLYGKGWQDHPVLGRWAHPALQHGADLRASYQAAAAHLHGTIHWNLHQRVTECILSGGVPLVRLKRDDLQIPFVWTVAQLAANGTPEPGSTHERRYSAAEHPVLARYLRQLQRLGFGEEVDAWLEPHPLTIERCISMTRHLALEDGAAWLAGDMDVTGFSSEAELEQRLAAIVEQPKLRADLNRGMRSRARRSLTYGSALDRIFGLVQSSLQEAKPQG